MEKNIGIWTFENFHGRRGVGSSKIRGRWVVNHWPEAEIYRAGGRYDAIIFQKAYYVEFAEAYQGIKILDVCDPDFLHWGYRVKQMVDLCDAVSCGSVELAKYYAQITDKPVWVIPDRVDPDVFGSTKKEHSGEAKVACWFGYAENYPMLYPAMNALIKNGYEKLLVIAPPRQPFQLPAAMRNRIELVNYPWSDERVNQDILEADVVLNPKADYGKWKFKSNNKTLWSWALGMPVAHNDVELAQWKPAAARVAEGEKRYEEVRNQWHVRQSVQEYKDLIAAAQERRSATV